MYVDDQNEKPSEIELDYPPLGQFCGSCVLNRLLQVLAITNQIESLTPTIAQCMPIKL